jgi:hypothetical protein
MQIEVQLVVCDDEGHEATCTGVVVLEKACQRLEHLGLTLTDAQQLRTTAQHRPAAQQAPTVVATRARCEHCGVLLHIKGSHTRI